MNKQEKQSALGGIENSYRRLRRTRMTTALRSMVWETELSKNDFIYPLLAVPGNKFMKEVSSMPGVHQMLVDEIVREFVGVKSLGIPAVILFGIPEHKYEGADLILTYHAKEAAKLL